MDLKAFAGTIDSAPGWMKTVPQSSLGRTVAFNTTESIVSGNRSGSLQIDRFFFKRQGIRQK
jgi:hypothetical protein